MFSSDRNILVAFRDGVLTHAEAVEHYVQRGMTADDAVRLLAISPVTETIIVTAYYAHTLSLAGAMSALMALGMGRYDASVAITFAMRDPNGSGFAPGV